MQLHPQYYYQQLPPQERAAYHGMLTCLQALAPSARIPRLQMETLGTLFFQLRLDHPEDLNGTVIPKLTQYALRITASQPVVAQFGRLDTTQNAMAYYVGVGYAE